MWTSNRTPQGCSWRRLDGRQQAVCGWLDAIFETSPAEVRAGAAESAAAAVVDESVCAACCRSFEPTVVDWNPVVASLAWQRAVRALERDGRAGSTLSAPVRAALETLVQRAESFLPIVERDEEDLPVAIGSREGLLGPSDSANVWSVEDIEERLPTAQFGGAPIERWALGVTTAPRRLSTLDAALESLGAVGLPSPRLFVDGDCQLSDRARACAGTVRRPAVGAWRNYYLTLAELLCTAPQADGLLVIQDDALWPAGAPLADYLARCRWPANEPFLASFYCCSEYTGESPGWRRFSGTWVYGAVAIAFSRGAAEALVSDADALARCRDSRPGGIDSWLGEWAARRRIPWLVPTPSLVQHAGDVSSLWETSRAVGVRRASRWLWDELPRPAGDAPERPARSDGPR